MAAQSEPATERQKEAIFAMTSYNPDFPMGYWSKWETATKAEASKEIARLKKLEEEKKERLRREENADLAYCKRKYPPELVYKKYAQLRWAKREEEIRKRKEINEKSKKTGI